MNILKTNSHLKNWKTASIAGVGMSAIGLVCTALIIGQLMPPILNGQAPEVSILEMAIESTVAILFLMGGFALMVIGADPFDEISSELPRERQRED